MTASLPLDAWYAVGSSAGLLPGAARAISLLGRDIAGWRGHSGRFHAWDNRCIHRGMRLSFGRVRGDRLICAYHGWNYDEAGRCCYIPARPKMGPSDKIATPRHSCADQDGLLWVNLAGASGAPPDLTSISPDTGAFVFVQSLSLPRSADKIAKILPRLVFLPSVLNTETIEPRSWRYTVEALDGDSVTLRWSFVGSHDGQGHDVAYRAQALLPGLVAITADAAGIRETRMLALQPQDGQRSTLHLLVALSGTDAALARRAVVLWGRRLRWFLENHGADIQAYNPWRPEETAP